MGDPVAGRASPLDAFVAALDADARRVFRGLDSPPAIQAFLDGVPYSADPFYRCPARVLRDRLAHCFDGALFAAAALRRLGEPPLIVDLYAERDDDHLLAVFRRAGRWGAVAQSNFAGLRYREPVYRNLHELVMSYFESFYNVEREKTLRGYTLPLDLRRCDGLDWMASDERLQEIADRLDRMRRVDLLTPAMIAGLAPVDERTYRTGLLGANEAGLYRPPRR